MIRISLSRVHEVNSSGNQKTFQMSKVSSRNLQKKKAPWWCPFQKVYKYFVAGKAQMRIKNSLLALWRESWCVVSKCESSAADRLSACSHVAAT